MNRAEFEYLARGFMSFMDPKLCFVVEIAGQAVDMSITFPDLNQAVKKMNGRLFPVGWVHDVFGKRKIDQPRTFMLGVKQEYQHLPLGALLYAQTWERGLERGVRGREASLILASNQKMRRPLEKMGGRVYETYRSHEVGL